MNKTNPIMKEFWTYSKGEIFTVLSSSLEGITNEEAKERQKIYGRNILKSSRSATSLRLLLSQFKSPITLILLGAAFISWNLGGRTDSYIIFSIVLISSILGFWQEKGASDSVNKLLEMIRLNANIIRNGTWSETNFEEIVPGDIVSLTVGDVIPADSLIIEANGLYMDEAALTGESFPVEKTEDRLPKSTPLSKRTNVLFTGSHVVSGSAKAIIVKTGFETEFGKIANTLKKTQSITEFERGVRRFGYMLMEITMVLVLVIIGINILLQKPVVDSFLFALAIAVGLTPQLLPAIINVNLAQGATRMAQKKVIVKKLSSIENFGSMDVLCSDKTGTLTLGRVKVQNTLDYSGQENQLSLFYASINSRLQKGFNNPIDSAISSLSIEGADKFEYLAEVPYDFSRKRIGILASNGIETVLICKGALTTVLNVSKFVQGSDGKPIPIEAVRDTVESKYKELSSKGFRTLGIAIKSLPNRTGVTVADEDDMIFQGFVTLSDPIISNIDRTIKELNDLGISLKIITGDNYLIAKQVAESVGFKNPRVLTGSALLSMSDEALQRQADRTDVFAEIEPNQKERIILSLQKTGHVVGYIGDGINDATALHASDVGISVANAVDVAKEAADIVLLNNDLNVLLNGVKQGRMTFANTLKYVFMATSANFGNMLSMAGASAFLSFLPLLPKQILLTNLLTDLPEMTISSDNVDKEWIISPRKWDILAIRKFMFVFGTLSSVFDFATFGVLLYVLDAGEKEFQSGWFIESVVSGTLVVLVVRTRKVFYKSMPGFYLLLATSFVLILTLALPYLPVSALFGFTPLPASFYFAMAGIVIAYFILTEIFKRIFYSFIYKD
ncbi:magnesium-importing ATPase [Leptospira inadai serovar Lyme str. 10]|uniref:Magnesium-transporting ATPase, P-type 1 n=2 Tax=Leptospira inadai serovar Lyme TaxID=293084 RepID=V6HS73_9LEPT|nr:magnesium-translocating P-type ATPase [Leptospira inadai]EQA35429.1 magnesium-importing ATPase [Leptospira inadai serovar Lyme str. 10]PNV73655.1 magnesium-translocating P-type ATPase [Leptospira inadai serovar Lyme]